MTAAEQTTGAGPVGGRPAAAARGRVAISLRLLRIARPVLPPLALSVVLRCVGLLAGTALLAVAAWGVTEALTDDGAGVATVVWIMVAVALGKAVARYLEQFTGHLVAFKALALLRGYFYDRLEPQAPAAVEGRRTGDLLSRVTKDVDRVEVFFAHTLGPAVTAVVVPLVVVAWLAATAPPLLVAVTATGWLLIGGLVPALGSASSAAAAGTLRAQRGEIAQHVTDSVQGVREVLAFSYADGRRAELAELGRVSGAQVRELGRWRALRRGANTALVALLPVALLLLGAGMVAEGQLDWATLAVVLAAVVGTGPAVLAVEEFTAELDQAFAAAARVLEVTEAAPVVADPAEPATAPTGPVDVTAELVTFGYPPRDGGAGETQDVLVDVDLHLAAGTTTALVGTSGSGKSTLGALLARFWDPRSGRVLIGGTDLRALSTADLRRLVCVVPQRPYLFNDTIEANLRLAKPDATDAEIAEVCRRAALTETVAALPDGLSTQVGEQGERLSGGQRQRLAIARALLRDTPVLVLDEVTSQLDQQTEAELGTALAEVCAGRTVLMIAHRLSTVRDADRIVVLERGRIVESGTHAELLGAGGVYRELLARQTGDIPGTDPY